MNFFEFGSNENMAILYKNYNCGAWLRVRLSLSFINVHVVCG